MNDPLNDTDDILSGSLGRLPREMAPPESLEDRTVARLRSEGLIHSRSRAGLTLASWVLAASIGAIAFVGGSVVSKENITVTPADPTFALTLVDGQIDDSAANVNRASEYGAWAASINATPMFRHRSSTVGGPGAVRPIPAIVNPDSVIVDEPLPDQVGIAQTYLVTAPTRDSALKLAEKSPHYKYGGQVLVQRVGAR